MPKQIVAAKTERSGFRQFSNVEQHTFTVVPDFSGNTPDPFSLPGFSYVLRLFAELNPQQVVDIATYEYPLGTLQAVSWSGIARRIYAEITTSEIVTVELNLYLDLPYQFS